MEALNAPALCTYMAAGTIAFDHSNNAGIFTGGAVEQRCVREADVIVLLGLDPVELIRKPWSYEARGSRHLRSRENTALFAASSTADRAFRKRFASLVERRGPERVATR